MGCLCSGRQLPGESEFLTFCRNMDIEPDSKRPKLNDSIEAARVVDGVVLPLPRPAATLSATGTGPNAGLSATSTSLDISSLPHPLRERTRVGRRGVNDPSAPVLFWSRKVLRSEENPALDAAIYAANELRAPLLVLLHIEDRYRHNTARRQLFLLQGAREMCRGLSKRGIQAKVHVARKGHRQASHLSL